MQLTLTAEQMSVLGLLQNPVMRTILSTCTVGCEHCIVNMHRLQVLVVCNVTVRATVRDSTGSQRSIRQ